jgi:hypothetical protein
MKSRSWGINQSYEGALKFADFYFRTIRTRVGNHVDLGAEVEPGFIVLPSQHSTPQLAMPMSSIIFI